MSTLKLTFKAYSSQPLPFSFGFLLNLEPKEIKVRDTAIWSITYMESQLPYFEESMENFPSNWKINLRYSV